MGMKLKVSKVISHSKDILSIRFKTNKKKFIPGQYFLVELPVLNNQIKRPYSISSSPKENYLEITFKKIEKGMLTPELSKLKKGDPATLTGPFGEFVYEEKNSKKIVLLGGGTGIAPLLGILRYCLSKKCKTEINLIHSARKNSELIFKKELERLDKENKNFLYTYTLTRDNSAPKNKKGRINSQKLKKYLDKKTKYYISGPPAFVDGMISSLLKIGCNDKNIKAERY
tara:strand:+ start:1964 stop:2647 length:684 start_codon:yes stop_codon:yes gene_type:complete